MQEDDRFDSRPKLGKKVLNVLPPNPEENASGRFPSWLHRKLPQGGQIFKTNDILSKYKLNTVCEEAKCPNRFECYSKKTATFLVLGKQCTRSCGFCDIDFSKTPQAPEEDEPERIALSVRDLGLKHVVITMVARDDLEDGGAEHLAKIMREVKKTCENVTIEVLTSDFYGNVKSLDIVLKEHPEVFNHNIETVRRLTPRVRHKATYERTLEVLAYAKNSRQTNLVKSGIMVGLGEEVEEVHETIRDLKEAGCDVVTIGHYLQADRLRLPVKAFITPQQFKAYADYGHSIGIKQVFSGPFVRSSYHADEIQKIAHHG